MIKSSTNKSYSIDWNRTWEQTDLEDWKKGRQNMNLRKQGFFLKEICNVSWSDQKGKIYYWIVFKKAERDLFVALRP
jgi:hypothetical protein